jgi:hypothetical protein
MSSLLRFLYKQRFEGFEIPSEPGFDTSESTEWFLRRLAGSTTYLEYGSGASTLAAARCGVPFVTVDSDRFFLASVRRRIEQEGHSNPSTQAFVHADIGLTKGWGKPVILARPSGPRIRRFRRYSDVPTTALSGMPRPTPDMVLVDGRFRAACALKALKLCQKSPGSQVVVDDYVGRPE